MYIYDAKRGILHDMLSFVFSYLMSRTILNFIYPEGLVLEACILFFTNMDTIYQNETQLLSESAYRLK